MSSRKYQTSRRFAKSWRSK